MKTKNFDKLLFDSCTSGDLEGVKLALKGGADIEYSDEEFPYTPFDTSVYHSHNKVVELLISNDVKVSGSAMLFAIDRRDLDLIKLILKGDLSEVIWAVIFMSISQDMENTKNDEVLMDIYRIIQDHLSASLRISYMILKGLELQE